MEWSLVTWRYEQSDLLDWNFSFLKEKQANILIFKAEEAEWLKSGNPSEKVFQTAPPSPLFHYSFLVK